MHCMYCTLGSDLYASMLVCSAEEYPSLYYLEVDFRLILVLVYLCSWVHIVYRFSYRLLLCNYMYEYPC